MYLFWRNTLNATFFCMHFQRAPSRMFLTVLWKAACRALTDYGSTRWSVLLLCSTWCILISMQEEFEIKWKSRDISGSASLALWANMNQSTTQLGSRRQSQGKHPYLTIHISISVVQSSFPLTVFAFMSFIFFFYDFCLSFLLYYFVCLCWLIFVYYFFCLQPFRPVSE